jgi:hypothetical protein
MESVRFTGEPGAFKRSAVRNQVKIDFEDELLPEGLFPDDVVEILCRHLTPGQKLFLSGLGRGLTPRAAALRAGCHEGEADKVAEEYMTADPNVSRLAWHVLRLRELASMDGEDPFPQGGGTVH